MKVRTIGHDAVRSRRFVDIAIRDPIRRWRRDGDHSQQQGKRGAPRQMAHAVGSREGRWVDRARGLANRIAPIVPVTKELLSTVEADDLLLGRESSDAAAANLRALDDQRFQMICPDCGHASRNSFKVLGRRVRCKHCGHDFSIDWGEPVD